jgi:hypothetical protein
MKGYNTMATLTIIKETDLGSLNSISYVKALVMAKAAQTEAIDKRHGINNPRRIYLSLAWTPYRNKR